MSNKSSKADFVKIMLDNDMDKSLNEIKGAESVKNQKHRAESIKNDYLSAELNKISNKSAKSGNHKFANYLQNFSPLQKVIATILIGSLLISGIVMLANLVG